jgi:hypothetical protein
VVEIKINVRKSMSEPSQSVSNRGGVRPGAGRPEGSVGPRRARLLRRRELIKAFSDDLGGDARLSETQRADVRRVAELMALSESMRASVMQEDGAGGPGALEVLIKLEGTLARAMKRLNLPKPDAAAPGDEAWRKFLADQHGGDG